MRTKRVCSRRRSQRNRIITISNCDAYDRNDPDVEWKESCYELVVTANWAADPRPSDEVLTKLLKQAFEMDD